MARISPHRLWIPLAWIALGPICACSLEPAPVVESPAPLAPPKEGSAPPQGFARRAETLLAEVGSMQTPDQLGYWLKTHARLPLDFDDKVLLESSSNFSEPLAEHAPEFLQRRSPDPTCEARTREEVLLGKPFHMLDRLGVRAPSDELARDLDLLGLRPGQWIINCYHGTGAGYTALVIDDEGTPRFTALRD